MGLSGLERFSAVVFFLVLSLSSSKGFGCSPEQIPSRLADCVSLEWSSGSPKTNQNSPFALMFQDMSGRARSITDLRLKTVLWMEMGHHSHGSKPTTTTIFPKSGFAFVDQVWFVMKGSWQIKIQLEQVDEDSKVVDNEELVVSYEIQ